MSEPASLLPPIAGARPKVLRRPQHFTKSSLEQTSSVIALPTVRLTIEESTPPEAAETNTPWQDDSRFAFAMLAIVISINLALIFWLNIIESEPTSTTTTTETIIAAPPAAPTAVLDEDREDWAEEPPLVHVLDNTSPTIR